MHTLLGTVELPAEIKSVTFASRAGPDPSHFASSTYSSYITLSRGSLPLGYIESHLDSFPTVAAQALGLITKRVSVRLDRNKMEQHVVGSAGRRLRIPCAHDDAEGAKLEFTNEGALPSTGDRSESRGRHGRVRWRRVLRQGTLLCSAASIRTQPRPRNTSRRLID